MSQSFDPRIMGVIELGSVMTIMLHGAIWTQVYSYHRQFPKDPLLLKSVVCTIPIFCSVHQKLKHHRQVTLVWYI